MVWAGAAARAYSAWKDACDEDEALMPVANNAPSRVANDSLTASGCTCTRETATDGSVTSLDDPGVAGYVKPLTRTPSGNK